MTTTADFAASMRGQLDGLWSVNHLRDGLPLGPVWDAAVRAGWFDLTGEGSVPAAIAAAGVLGAAACPLPLLDAAVAVELLPADLGSQIARGIVRLAVVPAAGTGVGMPPDWRTEAPDEVTALLVVGGGTVELRPVASVTYVDGVPAPAWGRVTLGEPTWRAEPGTAATDRALTLMRLGLAARAAGAAERLHGLAVEHACSRIQFGRPIGAFGAVQQRTATCQIDAVASALLIDAAARALDAADDDALLAAELAHGFVALAARRVLLGAHHTLAAMGFFEEHLGPWLFRRVHADVAAAASLISSRGSALDRLVESHSQLPPFAADQRSEEFRAEVKQLVAELQGSDGTLDRQGCVAELARRGWFGFGWPVEFGGRGASLGEQAVLHEELTYARAPVEIEMASVMLLGSAILEHGSHEQRARFLPVVGSGAMRFCLGYSEPETGSDLASVRTRAERRADGWLINGQKIWTTRADRADYIWLATRTDPDARPRHAGITVFLVPMSTPGIDVRPMTALSGERAATVFLDDVVVPDSARVGEVGGGWSVITHALAGERVVMGGVAAQIHRVLDDVLAAVRLDPITVVGGRGSARRYQLDRAVCELQALRALVAHATAAEGLDALIAAPLAGVLGGELAESFAETLLDVLGPEALLADPDGIGGGHVQNLLRQSVMYVVGGGTNDIQRGIIARSLGLPR